MPNTNIASAQERLQENVSPAVSLVPRQVMLVGLGPHARRIYMHYLKKHNLRPAAIIELAEKRQIVTRYMMTEDIRPDIYFIADEHRDDTTLSGADMKALDALIRKNSITHAILSTEPKAHMAYIRYFMSRGIHTLTDKPITAPINPITQLEQARQIEEDYQEILEMYAPLQAHGVRLSVQCQRRFHPAYAFVRQLLQELTHRHHIPITHMDIYHCDGMWNMPNEFLSRENHPYKYGYGKLYHSGYHFIDLAAWLMQASDVPKQKTPDNAVLYATSTRPSDFMHTINGQDYARLMGTNQFHDLTAARTQDAFRNMGIFLLIMISP
jgi:predicted dehydrogenase